MPLGSPSGFGSVVCVLVAQSCLTLCDSMDCSPPGSSVYGIFQARILEWLAISSSRGSSRSKDWTHISCVSGIAGASLVAQSVKNLPVVQETWVLSLGWEDPLQKGTAAHSSILAWGILWTVWSMGSQRVGHD